MPCLARQMLVCGLAAALVLAAAATADATLEHWPEQHSSFQLADGFDDEQLEASMGFLLHASEGINQLTHQAQALAKSQTEGGSCGAEPLGRCRRACIACTGCLQHFVAAQSCGPQ